MPRKSPSTPTIRGYCAAVRSAVTDDGRPPLAASGLTLKRRLEKVAGSLDRVGEKGAARRGPSGSPIPGGTNPPHAVGLIGRWGARGGHQRDLLRAKGPGAR